jgi:hypothetical protein
MRLQQSVLAFVLFSCAVGCHAALVHLGGPTAAADGPVADWMTPLLMADDNGRWEITIHRAGDSTRSRVAIADRGGQIRQLTVRYSTCSSVITALP